MNLNIDAAVAYLAKRKALHKVNTPIPVIGRDVDITRAALCQPPRQPKRSLTRLFHFSMI